FKNIIICHCGVLLILIVDLGRSLSTDYTALFSFHTPEMIIARAYRLPIKVTINMKILIASDLLKNFHS
ncbi:MAG: hypothetical protein LM517_10850, partial [Nitrosomonas sp.]|nr:hypothetical protein [Nitrosomonas sp.]